MPRLDFDLISQDDPPTKPFIEIYLADFAIRENETPLLSPRLYSKNEVDHSVNSLIQQLEEIRKKAKSKL